MFFQDLLGFIFLNLKSEASYVFQRFKAMEKLQFNSKIISLQIDWGGKFRPLTSFLVDCGIQHRLICPHTHHQNGVMERKHKHIIESGLTFIMIF